MNAMTPEEYVTAVYRHCLGRDPDPAGLETWVDHINGTGDATSVMAGVLASPEFQAKTAKPVESGSIAPAVAQIYGEQPCTIVDVGAQILGSERHIYQPICDAGVSYKIFGFEPLHHRVDERLSSEDNGSVAILPYAIADGASHTLFVNNDDATSSLFPLNEALCADFEHLCTLKNVSRFQVDTRRLDDVLPPVRVDFLKLDVQGAELLVLEGAERTLAATAVIHCEVEFAPIYKGQVLYHDIQRFLNDRDFYLVDLLIKHRYSYVAQSEGRSDDRLLWADAVFFKQTDQREMLAAQILAASLVYQKQSLTEHLLERIGQTKSASDGSPFASAPAPP